MRIDRGQWKLAGIMAAALVAIGAGLWLPTLRQIAATHRRIAALEQKLGASRGRTDGLAGLARDVQDLQKQVAANNKVIPRQGELAGLLRELSVQISQARLSDQGISTGTTQTGEQYTALPVAVTFDGNAMAAMDFLNRVENMPRLVQVDDLVMRSDPQSNGAVQVQMNLRTYFYNTETPAP